MSDIFKCFRKFYFKKLLQLNYAIAATSVSRNISGKKIELHF